MNTNTIPQRLRTWADRIQADDHMEYTELAEEIRLAAAELEAHDPVLVQANRHGSVAFQYLREEVARAMDPVHAAFDERAKAENPAADAVPVAVTDEMIATYLRTNDAYWSRVYGLPTVLGEWRAGTPKEATRESLAAVLSDHIAAVAALQARINELEARQVPESAKDRHIVVWPSGSTFTAGSLRQAQDYMDGAMPRCIELGDPPPTIVRYAPAETVPYEPQTDTSKEQP